MKKLLLFTLSATFFLACKNNSVEEKPVTKDYAVISGEVQNFKKRSFELKGYNLDKKIKFDKETRTFSDTLTNIIPGHYRLTIGRRPLDIYLTSMEDLKLSVDAKRRIKDPVFEGANATINNYLNKKFKRGSGIIRSGDKLFSLKEEEFLSVMDKYKSVMTELAENSQLPPKYLEQEKRNIHYEFVRNLGNYQNFHRMLYGDVSFTVSENFPIDIINSIDLNKSDDYLNTPHYRDLVKARINTLANERKSEETDFPLTYLTTVQTEIVDPLIKNDLIHQAAQRGIRDTDNVQEYYKKYMLYSTNPEYKKEITALYDKLKLLSKGQPSPKFAAIENFKGGTTSLDDLIGNGKYLYIDIWATWCGICKQETPLLKRLERKYHGKNIDFVSISVDKASDNEKWKKVITESKMGGTQLFAGENKESFSFTKDYLVKGLPRFIIIDPKGNIVSANAPRPSENEKLIDIFDKLGL
ncbi:TlpA family protein disulfide reductase [Tenacibaculum amylolyticum]|uniref:TlpA family protein disulfide reductase n=1 Tax=Tenacibaculum amylolyticum TaxID=104269 RepID=UPI0038940FC5